MKIQLKQETIILCTVFVRRKDDEMMRKNLKNKEQKIFNWKGKDFN